MILDRVPQHRSKALRKKLRRNGDVRSVCLSHESPYLNMIEEHWW